MEYPLDKKTMELFRKGFTEREIAEKLSVPTVTIMHILDRYGVFDI